VFPTNSVQMQTVWKLEDRMYSEVQMRASKCYNCRRFGHFAARCVNRQVFQQGWSYPRQVPQPPPDLPLPPNPPCPPPPPPVPVCSWWPRGTNLLTGDSTSNTVSIEVEPVRDLENLTQENVAREFNALINDIPPTVELSIPPIALPDRST
jgi:hypothetical protein